MNDKKHWYDGKFYDLFIAPNQDKLFRLIKGFVKPESTVIDIGCGTGRLPLFLADKCKSVTGLDLSSKNITVAENKLKSTQIQNVEFRHSDITTFENPGEKKYDYAIITYVLHEMPPEDRIKTLLQMKRLASNVIIGDYVNPIPKTFYGYLTTVIEFLAGSDHYNNFKDYSKRGGLYYLLNETGLKIIKEIKKEPNTLHLVMGE